MSKKTEINALVQRSIPLADGIFELVLQAKEIASEAAAGQFVSLYSSDRSKLLPRPISLCGINAAEGTIRLVYRVTGKDTGTEEFSKLREGDFVRVLGPLGNGYAIRPQKALIVGGGIGVPPMLELAKSLKEQYPDTDFTSVLGYRDSQTFLLDEFQEVGKAVAATEDGSVGTKGNVIDAIRAEKLEAEVIYACGPLPMLRGIKQYAQEKQLDCFVSMEERMACGIGACLACVCKTVEKEEHSRVHNARVCKDGPVFDAKEVDLS